MHICFVGSSYIITRNYPVNTIQDSLEGFSRIGRAKTLAAGAGVTCDRFSFLVLSSDDLSPTA